MIGVLALTAALGVWVQTRLSRSPGAPDRPSTPWRRAADQAEEDLQRLERGELGVPDYAARRREAAGALQGAMSAAAATTARQRRITGWFATGVICGVAALYAWLGRPEAPGGGGPGGASTRWQIDDAAQQAAQQAARAGPPPSGMNLPQMATRLASRLAAAPDDPQGWAMLARSYVSLGRFTEAVQAFERAASIEPTDAWLLADHAEALASTRGGRFESTARDLVAQALTVDARNTKALSLAGTIAYDDGDFDRAIDCWAALRDLLPPGSVQRIGVERDIQDARLSANRAGQVVQHSALEAPGDRASSAGEPPAPAPVGAAAALPRGGAALPTTILPPAMAKSALPVLTDGDLGGAGTGSGHRHR